MWAVPLVSSAGPFWGVFFYPLVGWWNHEPPSSGLVTAQCKDGILYVSDPTANETVGHKYKWNPGAALHAYDIALFWSNLRANIADRADAFLAHLS